MLTYIGTIWCFNLAREYLPARGGLADPGQAPKTFIQVRSDSKPLAPPHITKPNYVWVNIYISVAIWLGGKVGGFPLNLALTWALGPQSLARLGGDAARKRF